MESASQTLPVPGEASFPIVPDTDLDQLIRSNKRYIHFYFTFALCVVAVGILLIVIIFTLFGTTLSDAVKSLFGIGCGFISSLSTIQIKELLSRRDQQEFFFSVKSYRKKSDISSPKDYEAWKRKEDILWKILEKKATG